MTTGQTDTHNINLTVIPKLTIATLHFTQVVKAPILNVGSRWSHLTSSHLRHTPVGHMGIPGRGTGAGWLILCPLLGAIHLRITALTGY
ncbi:hypothetical protein FIBSPDRAFT_967292 [Athelia psychrophila]|uniref:Uncharacterized protein n=1 Tax=Athelia psychrophila TaxID=1759441 RepID=A0A167VVN1_9AGAM|nr:hypothetical protein FIBSPDRAFT_967292 [Fibularhizoctonia sp. CBS 109695]